MGCDLQGYVFRVYGFGVQVLGFASGIYDSSSVVVTPRQVKEMVNGTAAEHDRVAITLYMYAYNGCALNINAWRRIRATCCMGHKCAKGVQGHA